MQSLPCSCRFIGRVTFAVLLSTALVGCGGSGRTPPEYHPGDGSSESGAEVISLDHPLADGGESDAADSSTADAVVPPPDGPVDHPGLTGSTIAVNIVWEDTDGGVITDTAVVKTANRFAPHAEILVTTPAGQGEDLLDADTVHAEIWQLAVDGTTLEKMLSSTVLTESTSTVAGTDGGTIVRTYIFRDTPIDLSRLATGLYKLRVTGETKAHAIGDGRSSFYADSGLVITINKPISAGSYKGSITADVKIVNPVPASTQFDLEPTSVVMTIGNYTLDAQNAPAGSDTWITQIAFNSYKPPLDGDQLFKVVATNKRGTKVTAVAGFVIDNIGPTIAETQPQNGNLIGGIITISATITDPAGVLEPSVVAVVANGPQSFQVHLAANPSKQGMYSAVFDTRLLDKHSLFPSVSFRASDLLGNESSVGYLVSLDNQPPTAELDPTNIRVQRKKDTGYECSWRFDPVGPDAADDGELVPQLFDLRAMITDDGNTPLNPDAYYDGHIVALVDPNSVNLLVLSDTSQPLVVDTDGDGACDAVNPLLEPTTNPVTGKQALLLDMAPLPMTGQADFTPDPSLPPPDPNGLYCGAGAEAKPPAELCQSVFDFSKSVFSNSGAAHSQSMTVSVGYVQQTQPAIWTLPPMISDGWQNAGRQFDALASNIPDGWACLAVRAADKLGNTQVSKVMRVCIDSVGNQAACPDHKAISSVTCADGVANVGLDVTTSANHGLNEGEEVIIRNVRGQTGANGRFKAHVTGLKTVRLRLLTGADAPCARDGVPSSNPGVLGHIVPVRVIPDCTGTQTSSSPITVSGTACQPWSTYGGGVWTR